VCVFCVFPKNNFFQGLGENACPVLKKALHPAFNKPQDGGKTLLGTK